MKPQVFILSGEPQRQSLLAYASAVSIEKPLKVTIEPYVKKRSTSQMGLYFMWLTEVAKLVSDETGMDVEDFHRAMKERFLTPRVFEFAGETYAVYSTKELTVPEMATYLNQIYQLIVGEFGIILPLPEERLAR